MLTQRLSAGKISNLSAIVQWTLFVGFAILYLAKTYQLSSYAPYLDDYEALLNFLISIKTESSFAGKMGALFQQHNEHRIIIPRLIVWLQYIITGELNLRLTLFVGNIFLVAIVFVLIRYLFSKSYWGIKCSVIFLLFNYVHFENLQWALAALQNYGVVLLVLLSFIHCNNQHFKRALFFALLAALCSSTGILLFACYGVYFLKSKKYGYSIFCWLLIIGFYFLFYRFGYQSIHSHPGASYMLNHPIEFIRYYFVLSSSYLSPLLRTKPNMVILVSVVFFLLNFLSMLKLFLKDKLNMMIYVNLFLYMVFAVITVTRFNFGLDQAFASRYIIFSVLYLLVTCWMIIETTHSKFEILKRTLAVVLLLFSMAHCTYSFLIYRPYVKTVKEHLHNTICLHKQGLNPVMPYIGKNEPNEILRKAEELKMIRLERINCR